ncbi:MAG: class I SAM-dependent methyltransferase [bacterium]|jgi:SAM-dependent methyltransferase
MPVQPVFPPDQLRAYFTAEWHRPFCGWDFSALAGRMVTAPLSWDYRAIVVARLPHVRSLLDLDTGGGEFLAGLQPLPPKTTATEAYPPNIPVARATLEPLGVSVVATKIGKEDNLPFAADSFDLVINRHGSYVPREIHRILKPGCQFVTQQVGGENNLELNRLLGAPADFGSLHWNLDSAVTALRAAGFRIIEQAEEYPVTRVYDTGAIIYYLKAIPWQVPDFGIDRYYEPLVGIYNAVRDQGYVEMREHRFLLVGEKE